MKKGEKNVKCGISGVRKKKLKERSRKKKSKCFFWMKILLSSCSLFEVFFCKFKVAEKKRNFQSVFRVAV